MNGTRGIGMHRNDIRAAAGLLILVMVSCLLGGCMAEKADKEKVKDLDYTVVEDSDLPEELKSEIEQKKTAHFKYTYETGEYLYIIMGYGQQETGGYSITVKELYLSSNAVFFKTELKGPQKGETISQAPSCPYIVVKTEITGKPVVFE